MTTTRALTGNEFRTLYHRAGRVGGRYLMKWSASDICSITEANDARAAESHLPDEQRSGGAWGTA